LAADFGDELFRVNRTPRFIGFEEAHNFLPQNLKFEEQKRVLYAMDKFISEGRGSGLGFLLASQRLSKVNKDALEEVHNFFALRLVGPKDLKRLGGWLQHNVKRDKDRLQEILDDVAQMDAGEAWFLSPVWRKELVKLRIRRRVTYHSGRTPKPGERTVSVAKFSVTEAIAKLKTLFSQKSVAIQTEVADLREAKTRIRELERELKTAKRPIANFGTKAIADAQAIQRAARRTVEQAKSEFNRELRPFARSFGQIRKLALELIKLTDQRPLIVEFKAGSSGNTMADQAKEKAGSTPEARSPISAAKIDIERGNPSTTKRSGAADSQPKNSSDGAALGITPYQRDILAGLALLEAIGRTESRRALVAAAAGKAVASSTFEKYVASLKSAGLIAYGNGTIRLTDEGRSAAPQSDHAIDNAELHQNVLRLFSPYQRKLIVALIEAYPDSVSRVELGECTSLQPTSSTFERYVSALRSAEVIDYPEKGHVRAADWLFLD